MRKDAPMFRSHSPRERDPARQSLEQRSAELGLERAVLLRERRLRDAEALRRPCERAVRGDGEGSFPAGAAS
jgi:hypothetical protein